MSDHRPTREECEAAQAIRPGLEIVYREIAKRDPESIEAKFLALLDENANLKRDKERLDWLDGLPDSTTFTPSDYGTNIREAIHAAMESTASEGEPKA